jgi:mono/diheme cytochrome c family protein
MDERRGQALGIRIGRLALVVMSILVSQAFAADDATVRKGAKVYENNCATCHGDELQNNSNIAFDLRRLKADEHPRFVNSVLHGKNVMPAWEGHLTTDQIEQLWAYIRANANE